MSSVIVAALAFGYQPTPFVQRQITVSRRAISSPVMQEYRLNNYILSGPMAPLGNMVLVRLAKVDEKTTGGLFVPTVASEKPKEGTVVAAGPGLTNPDTGKLLPNPVKEGDYVLLSDFKGESVEYNSEKHILVAADTILGTFSTPQATISGFNPLDDRVLVEIAGSATETASGIALAALEEEDSNSGKVVAAGAGSFTSQGELMPMDVAVGDMVLFGKYSGSDATFEGRDFKIVSASQCLAKW